MQRYVILIKCSQKSEQKYYFSNLFTNLTFPKVIVNFTYQHFSIKVKASKR